MKRRFSTLPLLIVLASAPALRTAARAQFLGAGAPKDGGDSGANTEQGSDNGGQGNDGGVKPQENSRNDDMNSSGDSKPPEEAEAPRNDAGADMNGDEGKSSDSSDKPEVNIVKVVPSDDEKPAQAVVSVDDAPKPKPVKKKAKRAKTKIASIKTPDAVKKPVAPPAPPPPPPPAVPSTPVEPWNP